MRVRARLVLSTLVIATTVAVTAAPSQAAPFLPVGSGAWSSTNVGASGDCNGNDIGSGICTMSADSYDAVAGVETCNNASYVVTTPVIIGTNFGCNVSLTVDVGLAGVGAELDPGVAQFETGACAGITLSGAELTIHDNAAGTYTIHPRLVITSGGVQFEGNYVSANVGTISAVIIHAAGKITPACTAFRLGNGDIQYTFYGVFSGNYTVL